MHTISLLVTYLLFCMQTMALTSAYFSAHAQGAIGLCSVSNSSRTSASQFVESFTTVVCSFQKIV